MNNNSTNRQTNNYSNPGNQNAGRGNENAETYNKGFFNRVFGSRKQKSAPQKPQMNIKGQKVHYGSNPEVSMSGIENMLYKIDKGPRMLPRKQRAKVWGGLILIGGWITFAYTLIAYRLKADDLELMEREVYEDLALKKQIDSIKRESE